MLARQRRQRSQHYFDIDDGGIGLTVNLVTYIGHG